MPVIVDGYGNTGPSSIPLLISLLSNKRLNQQIKNNILGGFGIGLSWAACYVDLQDTKIKIQRIMDNKEKLIIINKILK